MWWSFSPCSFVTENSNLYCNHRKQPAKNPTHMVVVLIVCNERKNGGTHKSLQQSGLSQGREISFTKLHIILQCTLYTGLILCV